MKKKYDNQSIQSKADQLIRYYKVNTSLKKEDVLDIVLSKIEKGEKPVFQQKKRSLNWVAGLSAAATVAIIVTLYLMTATVRFEGIVGKTTTTLRLPDNSKVILQNDGEVKFRKYFWNRQLQLHGQAYFEVVKGGRFSVETRSGRVEVLGTRFLVSEINEDLLVQCFEGKVNTVLGDESFLLTAGMQVFSNSNGSPISGKVFGKYPEFAVFRKNFLNTPVEEVTKELETFFDVHIDAGATSGRSFSGAIETGNLETAMEILTRSLQLGYQTNENNQIIIHKN
jgi:ferric-dicitrate binding protein FerR (iron transport regulator)